MDTQAPVFQEFVSKDGKPLESLLTRTCSDGVRYLLWSDIQRVFEAVDILQNQQGERVTLVIGRDKITLIIAMANSWQNGIFILLLKYLHPRV